MIDLIVERLNGVVYNGTDSIEHLQRIIGAAKFVFADTWHQRTPRCEDFYIAIDELGQVEAQEIEIYNKVAFDRLKFGGISVLEKLKKSLEERRLDETDSLSSLLHGEGAGSQEEDIRFSLLLVEQRYIRYFANRPSHLPSQPHDRLFTHYTIGSNRGQYVFRFWDGDDTPDYIQFAATEAVKNTVAKHQNG